MSFDNIYVVTSNDGEEEVIVVMSDSDSDATITQNMESDSEDVEPKESKESQTVAEESDEETEEEKLDLSGLPNNLSDHPTYSKLRKVETKVRNYLQKYNIKTLKDESITFDILSNGVLFITSKNSLWRFSDEKIAAVYDSSQTCVWKETSRFVFNVYAELTFIKTNEIQDYLKNLLKGLQHHSNFINFIVQLVTIYAFF